MTDREKIIYDILCSDEQPPEGQHWEGFVTNKIVAALAQPNDFSPDWDAMAVMVEEQQRMSKRIEELEAALAQPEQEPTAYLCENAVGHKYFRWKKPSSEYKPIALYTAHASPQRIWQGLTDDEIENCFEMSMFGTCRAIEAKLKEKNGF